MIDAREGIPPAFLWLNLQQQGAKDYLLGMNAGASREAITKGHIESVRSILPPKGLWRAFNAIINTLLHPIDANRTQSRTLAQTRDLLLPKLMSGEIRLREAERVVEHAQ